LLEINHFDEIIAGIKNNIVDEISLDLLEELMWFI